MRDDLGVRLGDEPVAFPLELALQIEIVLDDPVVDDDDAARAVAVRVRVLLGRAAVRRPPRVADAVLALERIAGQHLFEARQLAGAAAQLDLAVAHDRHARRVIAAIFETPQPVDQNRKNLLLADVPDDPAHVMTPEVRCVTRTSFLLVLLDPAVLVDLLAARDAERAGGDVFDDRRSGRDVGALADADGRDELRVAADERAVLDDRLVLVRRRRSCT